MTAITLNLPQPLTKQIHARNVSEDDLRAVALAAIELWLTQDAREEKPESKSRFSDSAIPFTRRLISQNRDLFNELAKS